MIVESSSSIPVVTLPSSPPVWPKVLGTIITLVTCLTLLVFVISPHLQPTGSLLSPMPEGEIAESSPAPLPTPNLVIAAPQSEATASSTSQAVITASSDKKMITLPATTRELVVRDSTVTSSSYIYLTPISATNNPVYVKTKGEGYFIIATNQVAQADLLLEYYLIAD